MSCKGASAHRLGSIYSLLPRHIVSVMDGGSSGSELACGLNSNGVHQQQFVLIFASAPGDCSFYG